MAGDRRTKRVTTGAAEIETHNNLLFPIQTARILASSITDKVAEANDASAASALPSVVDGKTVGR